MRVAIMQPYLFPYLTYFQLICSADIFVIYDDVSFIKGGWINRNYILLNGQKHMFTVPLEGASSFSLIKDVRIYKKSKWRKKLLTTIEFAYKKTPYFPSGIELVSEIINENVESISQLVKSSFLKILDYCDIKKDLILSSELIKPEGLKGQDRVIEICKTLGAEEYINLPGGKTLYDSKSFKDKGLQLSFIASKLNGKVDISLSVIHLLMHLSKNELSDLFNDFLVD